MPFYIRDSVSVGPFRFNLSKSGVGISAGVKGLRVGSGPRGNYIHAGRHGLYYRKTLPKAGLRKVPPSVPVDLSEEVETGAVDDMVEAGTDDVIAQINAANARAGLWKYPFFAGLCGASLAGFNVEELEAALGRQGAVFVLTAIGVAGLFGAGLLSWLASRRPVVLLYELDGPARAQFERLFDAFERIGRCRRVWHAQRRERAQNPKHHGGATELTDRKPAAITFEPPSCIRTNVPIPGIVGGKRSLHFFPDVVLVKEGGRVGSIAYRQLKTDIRPVTWVEDGDLPDDAEVIGSTWLHPNKDGSPDRRFSHNKQLPVIELQEIVFRTVAEVVKVLMLSRHEDRRDLVGAIRQLGRLKPSTPNDDSSAAAKDVGPPRLQG